MAETKTAGDRRAQHVALLGLLLQTAAFVVLLGVSIWSKSHLLGVLVRFVVFGIPVWLVTYLLLNQIRRVGLESLETDELRRAQEGGTSQALFEMDDEALLFEQSRLKWMVQWLLPACTILVSVLLIFGHFLFWGWSLDQAFDKAAFSDAEQQTLMVSFVVGIAVLCFMFERWTLGATATPGWELLRGGAVCMAGIVRACAFVALALMVTAMWKVDWAEPGAAYIARIVLVILGVEYAVNFVLDLYRPRTPGELPRPSFDSRLLGMMAEPGQIAKSIAEAFNYQFGFQVSSTWFYQLLQRSLFPIMVFAFIVILALTSVVVVDAEEQVVIERFGRALTEPTETPVATIADLAAIDGVRVLGPGIHFKWPYPIDIVYRAPVKRVSELVVGEPIGDEDAEKHAGEAVVWTHEHGEFVAELMLLVASPKDESAVEAEARREAERNEQGGTAESVPVSLLMVSVPIEYRIKDIRHYLYRYDDPKGLMENVAYRYLSDYAAGISLDELIGPGRARFNQELKQALQERLDNFEVGVEIVFAGIRGAHPPAQGGVAAAFHSKISALTRKTAMINAAHGARRKILVSAVGKENRALILDEAIRQKRALSAGSEGFEEARERVDNLLMGDPNLSGEAARRIANARAKASRKVSDAAAKVQVFGTQVAAYQAAPELYKQRKALEVYEDLDHIRKYLIVGDRSNVIVVIDTAQEAGLDQVLSGGVDRERKKRDARGRQGNP